MYRTVVTWTPGNSRWLYEVEVWNGDKWVHKRSRINYLGWLNHLFVWAYAPMLKWHVKRTRSGPRKKVY